MTIRIAFSIFVGLSLAGCTLPHTMKSPYLEQVKEEFQKQPLQKEDLLTEADLSRLPPPVQRYLRFVGAIGKPKVQNFRVEFDVAMKKKADSTPMKGTSEQYNFIGSPTRLFYMKLGMFGIPADGLHSYREQKASMIVRVASLFDAVNTNGPALDEAETVTVLNDICLLAPAALIDPRFSFTEINDSQTGVTFQNGAQKVKAILYFGKDGELVDFTSEDRSALQDDGSFKKFKFSTPVHSYKEWKGRRVMGSGDAVWHYPEGALTYGTFVLKNIEYNLKQPILSE